MKIVYIEWIDSQGYDGWQYASFKPGTNLICKSSGFLFEETKEAITICHSVGPNGGPHSPLTIPKIAIKKIKRQDQP